MEGRVAIVTGGARGIGAATCVLLAKEGANVAVTDILDDNGREVVLKITSNGGVAEYWHVDVTKEKEVKQAFGHICERFGKIDVLVNNAGLPGVHKPSDETDETEWDDLMDVNLKGVFFCTKHVIPFMKKAGGGSIIDISSIYGIAGAGGGTPYNASKGAVRCLAKTDALYYAPYNIRVNSVHPGYIWTPLLDEIGGEMPGGIEALKKQGECLHPLGRIGEPDDIAYGILYLATDESKFITGSELVIDGGYLAQ